MNNKCLLLIIQFVIFIEIFAFPIRYLDFYLPHTSASAIETAMGGLNVSSPNDRFLTLTNPALLRRNSKTYFTLTVTRPADKYNDFADFTDNDVYQHDNILRAASLQSKRFGLAYQALASQNILKNIDTGNTYQDFYLNQYTVAIADSAGRYDWGINGKIIHGRIVYKTEEMNSINEFIDSSAFGYSFDIALARQRGPLNFGFVIHDIYSTVYWSGESNQNIRTRAVFGIDSDFINSNIGIGINRRWLWNDKAYYNVYYSYSKYFNNYREIQQATLRLGLASQTFKNQDNILFCLGMGYFYYFAYCDISIQTRGWKANETQYMLTITFGE